uniref:Uncharacterized protein n=1 Tax=Panagrolaimus sp. PS1159 TaxID=55785 RepID=A0AC35GXT6_9BILA
MRSLFNPLRCDVYNCERQEFVHHEFIPDPLFRIVSTTVSNTCILFKAHIVYAEFSTLNLVEVKHIRARHHVVLIVKRNLTFVDAKFCAYSFIFGTSNFARAFYQMIIRHVHREQVQRLRPNNPTQNAPAIEINADITVEPLQMETESVVIYDSNDTHASSLEHSNVDSD